MENDNEKSIQRLIMEISRMYVEKCFGKLKGLGIHPRQMPILAVLWKEDGCSQKELASQLGVKPPTVTVSIQRLEKIGIIVRKQDEKDQRISRIYLTEEGKAIINEGMRIRSHKAYAPSRSAKYIVSYGNKLYGGYVSTRLGRLYF